MNTYKIMWSKPSTDGSFFYVSVKGGQKLIENEFCPVTEIVSTLHAFVRNAEAEAILVKDAVVPAEWYLSLTGAVKG
jgi:hypothetical protein